MIILGVIFVHLLLFREFKIPRNQKDKRVDFQKKKKRKKEGEGGERVG